MTIDSHMDVENLSSIYQEILMTSTSQVTCTGISKMTGNAISHDSLTRLLTSGHFNEKYIWKTAKPICQELRGDIMAIRQARQVVQGLLASEIKKAAWPA